MGGADQQLREARRIGCGQRTEGHGEPVHRGKGAAGSVVKIMSLHRTMGANKRNGNQLFSCQVFVGESYFCIFCWRILLTAAMALRAVPGTAFNIDDPSPVWGEFRFKASIRARTKS